MDRRREKERLSNVGSLVVITGGSGSGKDTISMEALERDSVLELGMSRLITCTTRPLDPKRHEEHGVDYFFISEEEMFEMHSKRELVEKPLKYGGSYKATPKKEFISILVEGRRKFWRIEPSLANKVADGTFFEEQFPEYAEILKKITIVILVDVPEKQLRQQQKDREGDEYRLHKKEYEARIRADRKHIKKLRKSAVVIENLYMQKEVVVTKMESVILEHHAKIKNAI